MSPPKHLPPNHCSAVLQIKGYVKHQIATVTSHASATGTSKQPNLSPRTNRIANHMVIAHRLWENQRGTGRSLLHRRHMYRQSAATPIQQIKPTAISNSASPPISLNQQLPSHSLSTVPPINFTHSFLFDPNRQYRSHLLSAANNSVHRYSRLRDL